MTKKEAGALRRLPEQPNLTHLRKEAKRFLAAWRAAEPSTVSEGRRLFKQRALPSTPKLHHAQWAIARAYGFASWPRLVEEVLRRSTASPRNDVRSALAVVRVDAALLPGSVHRISMSAALREEVQGKPAAPVFVIVRGQAQPHATGSIGLLAKLERLPGSANEGSLQCEARARLAAWEGGRAVVDPLPSDPPLPPDLPAATRVRKLASDYARALGLSSTTIDALAAQSDPARLSDAVAPICTGDVCRHLLATTDPERRLTILAAVVTQMLDQISDEPPERTNPGLRADAWLVVVAEREGRLVGQSFALKPGLNQVGRALDSDVCLSLPCVSRRHCTIEFVAGRCTLFDCHSTNGLFVGHDRDRRPFAELREGDSVRIGSATMKLVTAPPDADAPHEPQPVAPVSPEP